MNPLGWIGPETTTALSLTLLHSLWQISLAVAILWCAERIWRQLPIERNYTLHAGTLLLTLAMLPMTLYWVQPTRQTLAAPPVPVELNTERTPPPSAVVQAEFDLPSAAQIPAASSPEVIPAVTVPSKPDVAVPASEWWPVAAMWVAACYVLGVLVMLSRLMLGIRCTERIRRRATRVEPGPLASTFARLARELGVGLGCLLATSRDVLVPTVVGVVKPTILLPASALTGLSASELEMILLHELAHVRRHDQWVNLVQRLAEVVLFFNPALWYLSRRIATLREYCCDELTCRQLSPGDTTAHVEYAATLLHVVELARPASSVPAELTALAATGRGPSELRRRVARLFGEPLAEPVRLSRPQGILLLAMALVLVGAPFARSSSDNESDTDKQKAIDTEANQRVAEARRRTFGLQSTPKIAIYQRMWNGAIPTMSSVAGDPAELLWRARGQDVDGTMRKATLTDLILAWDGPKLLIENASQLSGEHPWIQSRYWTGETGWLGEGSPDELRHYRYGDITKHTEHIAPYNALYWVAAGGRLPWGGPEVVLEENDTDPAETNYQQVGTEIIDGVECEIFIGPERMETIWIGKEEGLVKALTRHYVFQGLTNYYSDGVKEIAGRTFKDGAEYADWRRKQSPEMQKKLAAHWKAAAWAQSEPGNLTVFSDYREIVPGVEWPMRCEHLVSQPADREKGTHRLYRSETLVQKIETDFAIDELAASAIPPHGKEVTDRRAEQEVLYQWHPDLSESEVELKRLHLQIIRDSVKADQQKIDETPIDSVDDAITILLEGPDVEPNRVWVRAIKYLVDHKDEAFPVVLKAFDSETRDHPLSKLAFTLRAMDDPRAVPALIRALPRTLLPSRSDYGLIIDGDSELVQFVQQHDLGKSSELYFDYDRAFREVVGALHKLTDKEFGEMQLNFVYLGETSTQRNTARRQFQAAASRWAEWWDAEGHKVLVSDADYAKVTLPGLALEGMASTGPPTLPVGEQLHLVETSSGVSISSIHETNSHCFYDLDTGRESGWPAHLPKFGKIGLDSSELIAWAREEGFDLVGVNHTPGGEDQPLYCLKPIDLKAWKLSEQEHRELQDAVTGKKPYPLTNAVDLMVPRRVVPKPYDRHFSGDAFLYLTREGTAGVLRATEQVTDTNVPGGPATVEGAFDGVGFYRGLEFSLQVIAPATEGREARIVESVSSSDATVELPATALPKSELSDRQEAKGDDRRRSDSRQLDHARIAALQELVNSYTQVHDRIEALYKHGIRRNESLQQARLALEVAKGDLAYAKGDLRQAIEYYELAVAAADEGVQAIALAEDKSLVTLDVLLDAHRRRAEVKTMLNRLKEELAKEKPNGTTSSSAKPSRAVPVQCLDADQKPVAGAEVYVFQHEGGDNGKYRQFGPFTTDDDGKASCGEWLGDAEKGHYDRFFYARVPGKMVGVARSSILKGWRANPEGRIDMRPSRSVSGLVTVPDGFDPTEVTVRVITLSVRTGPGIGESHSFPRQHEFVGLRDALPDVFERTPDKEGRFEFQDVPAGGGFYLVTNADGLAEGQWCTYEGDFSKPVEIALPPEGRLTGTVKNEKGEPLPGIEVAAQISPVAGQHAGHLTTFRTKSDDQGKYELVGLPEWDLVLRLNDPERTLVFCPSVPFFVAPDTETKRDLTMELPIEVRGRVVDPDGNPVEAAWVSTVIADSSHSGVTGAVSDSDGNFVLRMPSGKFEIYFSGLPEGFKYPVPPLLKQIQIAPGQQAIEGLEFTAPRGDGDERAKGGATGTLELMNDGQPLLDVMAQVHGYKPAEDKVLARVAPPFDVIRMEYYRAGHSSQAELIEEGPTAMTFRWDGENLSSWGSSFGNRDDPGYTLSSLLDGLLDSKPQKVLGPNSILNKPLAGDWVMRTDADRQQVVAELEEILRNEFGMKVRLRIRNLERDVYVATGRYQFKPIDDSSLESNMAAGNGSLNRVQVFANKLTPDAGAGGGSGEVDRLLLMLGRWIDSPIVSELGPPSQRHVSWRLHNTVGTTPKERRENHEAEVVLANITRQTGIEFKKERRSIEVLFVEEDKEVVK